MAGEDGAGSVQHLVIFWFGRRPMKVSLSPKSLLPLRCALIAASFVLAAPASSLAESGIGRTFASAEQAVDALMAAVKGGNADEIVEVLGPDGRDLADSGDPVADKATREKFESAYEKAHKIEQHGDARSILIIGEDEFPFPIPIISEGGVWRFDTDAGAEEILARRIGENELAAVQSALAYVDAQREYAEVDHDGKGVQYARKFVSSDGQKDGLFWPTSEGEPESPLGPLVVNARIEGYAAQSGEPEPFHGYFFRILTSQGGDASGGAQDYVVGDRMIGGFALIAVPADYDNSGIMTFIVDQDGVVFQKDLGPETQSEAAKIQEFNPDSSWTKAETP